MDNEQTTMVTTQETTVDDSSTVTTESAPEQRTYTQEEYDKALASASSKAKYALLQELAIKNVQEFKDLKTKYDEALKERENMEANISELKKEKESLIEQNLIMKHSVADDYVEDCMTLAKSKVSETVTLDKAMEQVLEKNPTWKKYDTSVKIGTEKSTIEESSQTEKTRRSVLSRLGL